MKEPDLDNFFNAMGFGFPENSQELAAFGNAHKDYEYKANVNAINPAKILAAVNKSSKPVSKIDYHKRTVLAAEIVYKLQNEWTIGHLKLQKLMYLCQEVVKMPIHANFLKQTMGPYDPQLMRSLDKQFKEHKWFEFNKTDDFPKYKALENAGGHKEWFEKYYSHHSKGIDFLIETFRKTKTRDIELVATIYACWSEILERRESFSNDLITRKVYNWSSHKQQFSKDDISTSIDWMIKEGIHPMAHAIDGDAATPNEAG